MKLLINKKEYIGYLADDFLYHNQKIIIVPEIGEIRSCKSNPYLKLYLRSEDQYFIGSILLYNEKTKDIKEFFEKGYAEINYSQNSISTTLGDLEITCDEIFEKTKFNFENNSIIFPYITKVEFDKIYYLEGVPSYKKIELNEVLELLNPLIKELKIKEINKTIFYSQAEKILNDFFGIANYSKKIYWQYIENLERLIDRCFVYFIDLKL